MGFKLKLFLAFFGGFALAGIAYLFLMPISKEKIQAEIENWYSKNANGYTIAAVGATAQSSRAHLDRADEKNDWYKIDWYGMAVTIAFTKPVADIALQKDSLQAYFSYISVDNIQNRIASAGWVTSPLLAVSSYSEGIAFLDAPKGELNFHFTAEIFAVRANRNSEKCKEERGIPDKSMDADCFLQVEKKIPFRLEMSAKVAQ